MRRYLVTLAVIGASAIGSVLPAAAQVVIQEGGPTWYQPNGESRFLQNWNRAHEERNRWAPGGGGEFGPSDVISLLQRRGYQVFDVKDVGARYIVKAWRNGDNLLVSVSRTGEIMGVVHGTE